MQNKAKEESANNPAISSSIFLTSTYANEIEINQLKPKLNPGRDEKAFKIIKLCAPYISELLVEMYE